MEEAVDEFEVRGASADPYGKRDDGDDRDARRLHQHSRPELQIHRQSGKPSKRAHITLVLLRLFDAAECAFRRIARLSRRHSSFDELVLEKSEMRIDLARQIGLGLVSAEECDESREKAANFRHHQDSTFPGSSSSLSTSPANRR